MIKATVKQHCALGNAGHVEAVNLLYHGEDVILLHVSLRTKSKGVDAYGGATDEDVQSIWVGFDEIQLTLPEDFRHSITVSEVSRYELFIAIFKYKLLEDMTDAGCDKVELWCSEDLGEANAI